jgi:hypothetical protein
MTRMSLSSAEFDPKDPVNSFACVWQRVMLEPRAFFEGLPATGGLQPPLAFAAICLAIGAFGFMIFGGGLGGFLALLLIGLARLFVGSAIVALIAQQLFDGRGDYEATFRVLAYSIAPVVVIGIPVVKYFAALYAAYLIILGVAKAHSFDTVRAVLTLLATAAVALVLVYALGLGRWVHRVNPLLR